MFTPDGRYLYGSSYYTGVSNIFRYEVATGAIEAVSNAETGFFRPVPLADGRLVVLTYTGAGFVPAIIEPRPIKDVSAITFLGTEVAEKYPVVKTWQVPPPSTVDEQKLITEQGRVRPRGAASDRERLPGPAGLQELRRRRLPVQLRGSARFREPRRHRGVHTGDAICRATSAATSISSAATSSGRPSSHGIGRTSTTSSARPSAAARAMRPSSATIGTCYYDEPRKLDALFDFAYYDQIDTLPSAQNVSDDVYTAPDRRGRALQYTDVRRSIGAVEDEKGITWSVLYTGSRRRWADRRRSFAERSDYGDAAAAPAIRRSGRGRRAASPTATATARRSPISTSAASATTTSTTSRSSAIASTRRFPGSTSTRSARSTSSREMVELNPPPYRLRVRGHAEAVPQLAAAHPSSSAGLVDRAAERLAARRPTRASARRPICGSACCTGTT